MKNKKKAGLAGGAAAVAAALVIAVSNGGGGEKISLTYSITEQNEYVSVMELEAPDDTSVDLAVLYLNGQEVDKTIFPHGKFTTIPLVFDDLSRLELELYSNGELVGRGRFREDTVDVEEVKADA